MLLPVCFYFSSKELLKKEKKRKLRLSVIVSVLTMKCRLTPAGKNEYQSSPFCVSCSGLSVPYQNVDHDGAQKSLKDTI